MTEEHRQRIGLVGCVSSKRARPTAARDLYTSPLFVGRRSFVERTCHDWFILSAKRGLVDPSETLEPYDVSLASASIPERRRWAQTTLAAIDARLGDVSGLVFEIHAGAAYRDFGLAQGLHARGARVEVPAEGLRQGEQLAFYARKAAERVAPREAPSATPPAVEDTHDVEIRDVGEQPPFSFRWPDAVEHFERGWDFVAVVGGREHRVRHGVGGRQVYGRQRVHTVTWLDGQPMVEGVESDDYVTSRSLLSVLRVPGGGGHLRSIEDVPAGYEGFEIVNHRLEIDAKYSRDSLAVKIEVDDLRAWATHALLRARDKGLRTPGSVSARISLSSERRAEGMRKPGIREPDDGVGVELTPPGERCVAEDSAQLARNLLQFGVRLEAEAASTGPQLTPDREANAFVTTDPFAFLVGVIADQGIVAERAWATTHELRLRLGHLDPPRMLLDPAAVTRAFQEPPKLHRFVNNVPRWLVEAARITLHEYDGDAGRIWGDTPTAAELRKRFDRFPGIDQKKAAMAVEILARDLRVPIADMTGSDIAYDVHVRRVFMRAGLAQRDDRQHMIDVARRLHPERPGALDFPAWAVGRRWCHATSPDCPECPLVDACPKCIAAGDRVKGV